MSSVEDCPFRDIFRKLRKNDNYFKNGMNFFIVQLFLNKNYYAIIQCLNWKGQRQMLIS